MFNLKIFCQKYFIHIIVVLVVCILGITCYLKLRKPVIPNSPQSNPNMNEPSLSNDNNNFIYSIPNEIGQFFPTETNSFNMFDVYMDSQEALIQFPLTSPFFQEVVDENKFKNFSSEQQKELLSLNQHQIPRTFKFNLIEKILHPSINDNKSLNDSLEIKDTKFTFKLKNNAVFENNKPIDAEIIKYTLEKYFNLMNFKDYFNLTDNDYISIDSNNRYVFTLNFQTETSLLEVIKKINKIYLLESTSFEKSIIENQTKYGTQDHPFISYGPYKIKEGYNSNKWILEKSTSYFDKSQEAVPYNHIEILIEHNNGCEDREKELFLDKKISYCAIEANKKDERFEEHYNTSLFCKPDSYSLILKLSDGGRVENMDLRKALFYAIDRKKLSSFLPNIAPSLNYMSDNYCYPKLSSVKTYNLTNEHKTNINDKLQQDLNELPDGNIKNQITIQKLKDNYGYNKDLARYFFQKYITDTNSDGVVTLTLSTREGMFTSESFIGEFKKQLEECLSIASDQKIIIDYRLNDTTTDLNIFVSGMSPECFIFPSRTPNTLTKEEKEHIHDKLEPQAYKQLFMIPLCSQRQIRFLHNPKENFKKYFIIFGFRNQPLDYCNPANS